MCRRIPDARRLRLYSSLIRALIELYLWRLICHLQLAVVNMYLKWVSSTPFSFINPVLNTRGLATHRLYLGSIKALSRLYQSSIKALLRLYYVSTQALLTRYLLRIGSGHGRAHQPSQTLLRLYEGSIKAPLRLY